ncbi:hypothetical protein [Streptomyces sp. NPDC059564]|uniref:hypothetical protein n=1 Tax=Streptomyces sp. NPDC059564 TaxID=3346865 RepID=UPI0036A76A94
MVSVDVADSIRRRYREGVSLRDVAAEFGVSKDTVQRLIPAEERRNGAMSAKQRYRNRSKAPDETQLRREVVRLYRSPRAASEVASLLNISPEMVLARLPKQLRRTPQETARLVGRRTASRLPTKDIIRRYKDGASFRELGIRYGVHPTTIQRRVPRVLWRPRGPVPNPHRGAPLELPVEEIRRRYQAGTSIYRLAKVLGVSESTIRRRIPEEQRRGRQPQRLRPEKKRKKRPAAPRRSKLRISEAEIRRRYLAGESASSLARAAGVTCMTIVSRIPEAERRTNDQAKQASRKAPGVTGTEIRRLCAEGQRLKQIAAASGLSVTTLKRRLAEDR